MGFIEAVGMFDSNIDANMRSSYFTVPVNIDSTAALFPAVLAGQRIERDASYRTPLAGVKDGSKIVVPEGYGLLLSEDGRLIAFIDRPGSYVWYADSIESPTYILGGEQTLPSVRHSWEYIDPGSRPERLLIATFVRLKELPSNRFGTQSTIYWDDAYLNSQVGAVAHGTYSLKIVDPIRFAMDFVPASFWQNQAIFDFTDWQNPTANQMFHEIVGSLSAALSRYVNAGGNSNRITRIQQDSAGFASTLSQVVEEHYSWQQIRGVAITKVAIMGIEYDERTEDLLREVQRVDALASGPGGLRPGVSRGEGVRSGPAIGDGAQRMVELGSDRPSGVLSPSSPDANDLIRKLENLARALEAGLITQSEYDAAKAKALDI